MAERNLYKSEEICVLSGRYPESSFKSQINHKAYCLRHGYTYIYCNWPTGAENPYMNKVRYIQSYYQFFKYIFWIDDDAFFIDLDIPLTKFLPTKGNYLSICKSPDFKKIFTYFSSGQFFISCDKLGKSFIDEIEKVNLGEVGAWWRETLGFFTNGDQDSMVYLVHEKEAYKNYNLFHYMHFNSRIENLINGDNVFILHITGKMETKEADYLRAQKFLKRSPTLLAPEVEKLLNIKSANQKKTRLKRFRKAFKNKLLNKEAL